MSKVLLLRIFLKEKIVSGLYSDGLDIAELELVKQWARDCIGDKIAMEAKK